MSVQKNSGSKSQQKVQKTRKRSKRSKSSKSDNFVPVYSRKETLSIDTTNDDQMVKARLRAPLLDQDPEWHRKTIEERVRLSKVKKIKNLRASSFPIKEDLIKRRLTVYLLNPNKLPNFKTTYSEMIESHKIPGYLDMYFTKDQISKVYYNGKVYKPKSI